VTIVAGYLYGAYPRGAGSAFLYNLVVPLFMLLATVPISRMWSRPRTIDRPAPSASRLALALLVLVAVFAARAALIAAHEAAPARSHSAADSSPFGGLVIPVIGLLIWVPIQILMSRRQK
jgi:hypothetical protein